MKLRMSLTSSFMIATAALAACQAEDPASEVIAPTWSEFRDASTKYFEGKAIYVVDGDIAVSLDELRAEYDRLSARLSADGLGAASQSSTVNRVNGQDDIWSSTAARNLRYCVSNEFGTRKTRAVKEMALAAADWEASASVDFHYVSTEDGNCHGGNLNVTFAVRPWTGGGACAFFPSGGGCVARTVVVDFDDLDGGGYDPVTSLGVFRHELGHTLGLRHEHIRAPGTWCTENTNWRSLTPYDASSVMHYPWCPGATNAGDLWITASDTAGIASLYPKALPTAGLSLWLRSDQGVTSSSGRISMWADQSGNGRHATMATTSRQPTLVNSALAGKPVVRFGGAQSMYLTSPVQPTQFTVFVVGKNSKTTESFSMILGPGGNYANNQLRWENGSKALFVGTGNGMPVVTSTIGNTRVYHALSASYNGSTMTVFRDGNTMSSHNFTTTGPWTLVSVGSYYSSYYMIGDLAEVMIYDRVLSSSERTNVNSYLRQKYSLP